MGPPAIVIDASIALSIVRAEPEAPAVTAALSEWTRAGARTVVPSHFWFEVANALLTRRRWTGEKVLHAVHELDRFRFETIDLDRATLLLTLDMGERHGLTVYDAAYLSLAITLDGSLATFDAALRTAAGTRARNIGPTRLSETPAAYERDVTWPNYKGASAFLAKLRAEAVRLG